MSELAFYSVEAAKSLGIAWPDVYFTPGYGHACEASDRHAWEIAVWKGGLILQPFLRRPVDPALAGEGLFDIVSPYGYSGTWSAASTSVDEWRAYRGALREALTARGCLASFQRCSSLVHGREALALADAATEVVQVSETIAIDLARGYDACWAAAESRARTKTRKARKRGYTWSCHPAQPEDINANTPFRRLYDATMEKVSASSYYLFPEDYYARLQEGLEGDLWSMEVRNADGEIGVAGLFFTHKPLLHAHLVGSAREALRDGAGNMLYDGLIRWGCEQGFDLLHVGGGLKPEDRLFYFKRGFGGHAIPFCIARSVLDPARYSQVVAARAAQTDRSVQQLEETGYFPVYRG